MKYIVSPEFHRQLWLRFSPFRLLAAPVVMALIVLTTHNSPHFAGGVQQIDVSSTLYAAMSVFYVTVILWGTYEAATAMQEEVRGNTWDFQRMSSISPAQLALGKLFGATSYSWYFGLIALLVFATSYISYHVPDSFYGPADVFQQSPFPRPPNDTLYVVFAMIASGLAGQLVAFLYSFADVSAILARGGGRGRVPRGIGAFVVGAAVGTRLYTLTVTGEAVNLRPRADLVLHQMNVHWFGADFWRADFVVWSFIFFIGWFMVAAWRLARAELLYRNLPWIWTAFVASAVAWYDGFIFRRSALSGGYNYFQTLLAAFVQVMFICYIAMFLEAHDNRRYDRLAFHAGRREWRRAFENMPRWLATAPLALILMAAVVAAAPARGTTNFDTTHVAGFSIALALFMVRDGLALHAIQLTQRGRGAGFMTLFYYLLAYGLLPLVSFSFLSISMEEVLHAARNFIVPQKITHLAAVFFPIPLLDPATSVFMPLVEALAMAAWLYSRVRKPNHDLASPAG